MRVSVVACAVLALACPFEGCDLFGPGTFAVTRPAAGDEVAQGVVTSVRWSLGPEPGSQVDILVKQGGETVFTVASGAANRGSASWQVPSDFPLGSGYQVVIDDGRQIATGGIFSIVLPRPEIGLTEDDLTFPVGAARDTFQVFNDGPDGTELRFSVEVNRSWLLVSPRTGQSSGRGDRATISVEVVESQLRPGPNNARITVEATGVSGVADGQIDVIANRPIQ